MYIRPEARRRGLARALLDALESAAVERGATDLILDTHHSLTGAIALGCASGLLPGLTLFNDNPNT